MNNSSLPVAFGYLMQTLGRKNDQAQLQAHFADLEPDEDPWNLITLLDPELQATDIGEYGTWPAAGTTSVIQFQFQDDDEPFIEVDGEKVPNTVNHFCFVADAGDRQIIDSNGVLKNGNVYGNPIAYASYEIKAQQTDPEAAPKKEHATYKVLQGGQNCWDIARQLNLENLSAQDIADHNDLDDPQAKIAAGTLLHLPFAIPKPEVKKIRIEALDTPWPMHVSKPGGTRKYAFGNVHKLADLKTTGPMAAEGANVTIYGIAHVPIGEEIAAFYLEANAFGNYKKTGNIAWAVGFNHSHLDDGHIDRKKPAPAPQVKEIIQAKLDEADERRAIADSKAQADAVAAQLAEVAPAEPEFVNPHAWKATYRPWKDAAGNYTPRVYLFDKDMFVENLDTGKKVPVRRLDGVLIGGPFEGPDGKEYYRPQDSADQFTWFAVDPDLVSAEDDVFSTEIPIEDRVRLQQDGGLTGKLNHHEKYVTVPLFKLMGKNPRIRAYINKQINKSRSES